MRPFHFTLEPIQALRKHEERAVMKELALELERSANLEHQLDAAQRRLDEARRPAGEVSTASVLVDRQRFVERLETVVSELSTQAEIQRRRVHMARGRLAEAMRARETLDKLEQRRREAHVLEEQRAGRNAADEISLQAHLRGGAAA
jgi:flagellar export protein FliJ